MTEIKRFWESREEWQKCAIFFVPTLIAMMIVSWAFGWQFSYDNTVHLSVLGNLIVFYFAINKEKV